MLKYLLAFVLAAATPATAAQFTYTPNDDEFAQTKNWAIEGRSNDGQWALSFGNLPQQDRKYDAKYIAIAIQPTPRGPTCDGVFLANPLDLEWFATDAAGNRNPTTITPFDVSNFGDGTFRLTSDGERITSLVKALINNVSISLRYKDNCGGNTATFSLESIAAALKRAKADRAF